MNLRIDWQLTILLLVKVYEWSMTVASGIVIKNVEIGGKRPVVCVPVQSKKAPADAVVLPECLTLSVLYCGDYSGINEAWLTLGREVKTRGLVPADAPRVLGIVAAYTGREIEAKLHIHRIVHLPLKPMRLSALYADM